MTSNVQMAPKTKNLISVLCVLIVLGTKSAADNPWGHGIGAAFSPKGCGVAWEFYGSGDASSSLFVFGTDFYGVIVGREKPGYKLEYFLNYDLKTWQGRDGLKISVFSGPGAIVGYLRDKENAHGLCAGLAADAGVAFTFRTNFKITAGFAGALAYHIANNSRHDYSVNLYKNGILTSVYPVVGIRYTFR